MKTHNPARRNTNQISGSPEGPIETKDDDEKKRSKRKI